MPPISRPAVSQMSVDKALATIYLASIDRIDTLPPKQALPALGIRWLSERYGYDTLLQALRSDSAAKLPDAVLYELRFCASWLAQWIIRVPPPLEELPALWDNVKTLHVSSFDPDVLDGIVKRLARIRKRADILDASIKTVQ